MSYTKRKYQHGEGRHRFNPVHKFPQCLEVEVATTAPPLHLTAWVRRHNQAVANMRYNIDYGASTRVLDLCKALVAWCERNESWNDAFGTEQVVRPIIEGIRAALNFDCGDLDCGTMDAWLCDMMDLHEIAH